MNRPEFLSSLELRIEAGSDVVLAVVIGVIGAALLVHWCVS